MSAYQLLLRGDQRRLKLFGLLFLLLFECLVRALEAFSRLFEPCVFLLERLVLAFLLGHLRLQVLEFKRQLGLFLLQFQNLLLLAIALTGLLLELHIFMCQRFNRALLFFEVDRQLVVLALEAGDLLGHLLRLSVYLRHQITKLRF